MRIPNEWSSILDVVRACSSVARGHWLAQFVASPLSVYRWCIVRRDGLTLEVQRNEENPQVLDWVALGPRDEGAHWEVLREHMTHTRDTRGYGAPTNAFIRVLEHAAPLTVVDNSRAAAAPTPVDTRPSWAAYHMALATCAATRGSCDRAQVGAVLVDDHNRLFSSGYNGAPRGVPSCLEAGHLMVDGHCVRTLHAERNAIMAASSGGRSTEEARIFTTHFPCFDCVKMIIQSGIREVTYSIAYRPDDSSTRHGVMMLLQSNIKLARLTSDGALVLIETAESEL